MRPQTYWTIDAVKEIIEARKLMIGPLLPILHGIQDAVGHIPPDAVPVIARELNLSRAEVHGVITYYPHFRQVPAGNCVVQICRAEACQSVGADSLAAHARKILGCDFHETSVDGKVTLEPVYCLGQCAVGPAITIDDAIYARMTPARFDRLIDRLMDSARGAK